MRPKPPGARARIASWISSRSLERITETVWLAMAADHPDISEAALKRHLKELGILVNQPMRGVRTDSLDWLEETLIELADLYSKSPTIARELVIQAKDKARHATRNAKAAADKRTLKAEMVEWMLVWLGDPRMFEDWARLRRAHLAGSGRINPT